MGIASKRIDRTRLRSRFRALPLIFHTPVVLLMLWLLGRTMAYVPPILG